MGIKLTSVFVALRANIGALILGFMLSWSAPIAGKMIENENYNIWVTSKNFGWIVGVMALGGSFAPIIAGTFRTKFGTKTAIIVFCLPIILGYLLIILATHIWMLLLGRFLAGMSVGCFAFICPFYTGEIASNEIRGTLLSFFQININIGIVSILTVGYFAEMTTINIMCMVIPILYAIIFFYMPESPPMSMIKCRQDEAAKTLRYLHGDSFDSFAEIERLKTIVSKKMTISQVLKVKSTQNALKMELILFVFFQMSAINVVLFYSTLIFTKSGVDIDPGISSIIIGLISLISSLFASAFIDKFGRRILICTAYALTFVGLSGISIFFILDEHNISTQNIQWLPLLSLCLYMSAFNFGTSPVTYTLLGEIFTSEAKKFVAPICQTLNFSLTFVLGMTFPTLEDAIGIGYTFLIFSISTFFGFIFTLIYVPETKGKSQEEISAIFK